MRLLILSSLVFFGCKQDNQLALVPQFVAVEKVNVVTGPQGSDVSHQVSEVWLYADSNLLGAFPVPAQIPIIPIGQHTDLEVFAGIRENGLASSPVIYPFYSTALFKIPSSQTQSSVEPQFHYLPSTTFALDENFEVGNVFREDLDGDDETRMDVITLPALDGRVGALKVTATHPNIEVASAFTLNQIPANGTAVFLEVDYLSEVSFAVGLRGSGGAASPVNFYKLVLFPNPERTKVYINFTPDIQTSDHPRFQVIFQAVFDTNLSLDTQYVYLDNIKMLHF